MRSVRLLCLTDFKFGESEEMFRKNIIYSAKFEDGLYTIEKGEEKIALENLSIFFREIGSEEESSDNHKREYVTKEEVCLRMGWEDFSIGSSHTRPKDFEKVGLGQYAVDIKKRSNLEMRVKTRLNKSVLIQNGLKYEDIVDKTGIRDGLIPVVKIMNKYTRLPTNIDCDELGGRYTSSLYGFTNPSKKHDDKEPSTLK